ncbi:hypothetical protein SYNPS1DRAFT_25723 [Syncephalis pseudoplumigaleata]|uniref:Uncharacterized protein n=1 Tax=Syncephalis pseudoplumigaleata TaxID=1712513 RepID=A0A4V1J0R8_9FUNG|nr:hypothetical protein SYNPS1DRAFT_25723 [Syncephalis pseudoplumigaleata]|eukprot:RKP22509.1 hypothetical protein SYNPS1DRAFT_25723 [Syncephalis pseudoplumigaleata]
MLPQQIALIAGALLLMVVSQTVHAGALSRLHRRGEGTVASVASASSPSSDSGGSSGGLNTGAIVGICACAGLILAAGGFLVYRRRANQARPMHGGRVATVVAMRGAGAMNLQGNMAVLAEEDDDFHIGTQQGVISYTSSNLEKPPRAARPMSWYKAREAGVSPLHMHAITARAGGANNNVYPIDETDPVELYSPGGGLNGGSLQTPMVGNVAPPQAEGVQIVIERASNDGTGRPLPQAPILRQATPQQLAMDTPVEGAHGDYLGTAASTGGHITDVEWDSDDDEGPVSAVARAMTPMTSEIVDANVHVHPRLFILTPGRDGIEALRHPENWSRTTFQLRLLCEGAASDYSEAHLTEEHGISIREPNAFLRHAARYVAQTADALIARDDSAFEQAEVFASSSDAGEYLEQLADTLRAWYSDQLVALEEAAAEGHEVDQELLEALRAQKDDPSSSAKAELSRFLDKYDSNRWNGGLRARKIDGNVRWLCASCASRG